MFKTLIWLHRSITHHRTMLQHRYTGSLSPVACITECRIQSAIQVPTCSDFILPGQAIFLIFEGNGGNGCAATNELKRVLHQVIAPCTSSDAKGNPINSALASRRFGLVRLANAIVGRVKFRIRFF
jgi:hypothetical protein